MHLGYLSSFLDVFSFCIFFPFACFSSFFSLLIFPSSLVLDLVPSFSSSLSALIICFSREYYLVFFWLPSSLRVFFPTTVFFVSPYFLLLDLPCNFFFRRSPFHLFFFLRSFHSFPVHEYSELSSISLIWWLTVDHLYCSSITLHWCFSLYFCFLHTNKFCLQSLFYICCQTTLLQLPDSFFSSPCRETKDRSTTFFFLIYFVPEKNKLVPDTIALLRI